MESSTEGEREWGIKPLLMSSIDFNGIFWRLLLFCFLLCIFDKLSMIFPPSNRQIFFLMNFMFYFTTDGENDENWVILGWASFFERGEG